MVTYFLSYQVPKPLLSTNRGHLTLLTLKVPTSLLLRNLNLAFPIQNQSIPNLTGTVTIQARVIEVQYLFPFFIER